MLFNTIEFGIFFITVFLLYVVLPHKAQNYMLLAASYFFYGCWDYRFLALIFISTTVDFFVGGWIYRTRDRGRRKHILFWSILFNLGFLGFFKYYGFFAESLQGLLAAFGLNIGITTLHIVLPVGISFYTFQSMSYTFDIYRDELKPTDNYFDFALCVAFFPHMVAGPIQRAQSLIEQVTTPRKLTRDTFTEGFYLIIWGLFKKMVIADNMSLIVEPIFSQSTGFTAGKVFVGALGFAFQIYGDFSGYSDIARGTARLLGFNLMVNFNLPYFATNPQDFWRRWHISLSTWLRDYLYVSLGGNRKGEARTYFNLMITMILGGLWHGASWTFVIWGAYHGALLCIHRAIQKYLPKIPESEYPIGAVFWKWTRIAFMFSLTLYGWLIFRAKDFAQLAEMTRALFDLHADHTILVLCVKILLYSSVLLFIQLWQYRRNNLNTVRESPMLVQTVFYLTCFYLVLIFGVFDAQSFIYFQF